MKAWFVAVGWISLGLGLSGSLSGCSTPASMAANMERARVRLVHLAPDGPAVDLVIGGKPAIRYVPFGMVSDYVSLPGGQYDVAVQSVSSWFNPRLDGMIASAAASLPEFRTMSILVVNESAKMGAVLLDDTVTPLPDQALVRLVHGIPDAPPLQWSADQRPIFTDLAFGEVSTYLPMKPGYVSLSIEEGIPTGRELGERELQLLPGKAYTIYAAGLLRGEPGVKLVHSEDLTTWSP
ncbi:MAG: hypothetical protein OHK0012_08880 [Synechococcales cyanobacterium]